MAKKIFGSFDEITNSAKGFVEKQKGMWDNAVWENYLSDLKKKGDKLTAEATALVGSTVESIKNLYTKFEVEKRLQVSSLVFDEIFALAKNFVVKQKGEWDHIKWENFISDIEQKGVTLTEDTTKLLGSILEALKKIYFISKNVPKI